MVLRRITLIALCVCILVIQEYALSYVPNVQFSTLLVLVYSRNLKLKETLVLLASYVLLDNMLMASFRPDIMLPMFAAWLIFAVFNNKVLNKTGNSLLLAVMSALFAFVYSWIFVAVAVIVLVVPFAEYLLADIPFELILAASNFVTVLLLFKPLDKFFKRYGNQTYLFRKE